LEIAKATTNNANTAIMKMADRGLTFISSRITTMLYSKSQSKKPIKSFRRMVGHRTRRHIKNPRRRTFGGFVLFAVATAYAS
jgi:hypothetical protein